MRIKNLPVRRDAYLTPTPTGVAASLSDPRVREMKLNSMILNGSGWIGGVASTLSALAWFISCAPPGPQDVTPTMLVGSFAVFVSVMIVSIVVTAVATMSRTLAKQDTKILESARSRVLNLINGNGSGNDEADHGHFARSVLCNPDDWNGGRDLLMRLDAIAVRHAETAKRIEHDPEKSSRARRIARDAAYGIIAAFKEQAGDKGGDVELEDLSRACSAIASGQSLDAAATSYAPTARIGRIISTAERMLKDHPGLVDAQGARVDALIRVHVPRLLERHRIAAASASAKDLEAVDAQLDTAIEQVRESVQEAADMVHGEAMKGLATELRFLELRRAPATTLLMAVA